MIEGLFAQPGYLSAKRLLDAAELRQKAIASNLANLETPNYRRVDLDPNFLTDLQRAMSSKDSGKLAALQPRTSVDLSAVSSRRDGNTVELDTELINLNQNTVAHALGTQLITSSLLRLRTAITGKQS